MILKMVEVEIMFLLLANVILGLPGKIYKLKAHCSVDNIGNAYLSISYSSKINTHAVDVADY